MSIGNIILFSAFIQNIILNKVYGIDTFKKPLKTKKYNLILGSFIFFGLLLIFILFNLLDKHFLSNNNLTFLNPFLLVMACTLIIPLMIFINEKVFKEPTKFNSKKSLILLSNMISIGIILANIPSNIIAAIAAIVGYLLMIVMIKAVELKLESLKMPSVLKGYPILLITIGLISAIISRYI